MSKFNATTGLILDENLAQGVRKGSGVQVGISDFDQLGNAPEAGVLFPWVINPVISWIDYQAWVVCKLDSGIVVHRILPQTVQRADMLASGDAFDQAFAGLKEGGPNLRSLGNFANIKQRMANSVYRFCLSGFARRAGYSIPFPSLKAVAGIPVIPDDDPPQTTVGPYIVANNSGIPIYYAAWQFWYTVASPPRTTLSPPPNLAEHIASGGQLPQGIQVPVSVPDAYAVKEAIPELLNPIQQTPGLLNPVRTTK